jgi:hypothetical protein
VSQDNTEQLMQFILEQQAALVVSNQQASERMAKIESVVLRLANATENRVSDLKRKMESLVDAQMYTEQRMAALADSQTHSDARLNALIDIVSQGRDGKV